jgi:HlyD family secretion protein
MRSKFSGATRIATYTAIAMAIAAALYIALSPKPVPVDTTSIDVGTVRVTVSEEGVTRIREVYQLAAPIDGRVARSSLEVGDAVIKDETVVATIYPVDPPFLDARTQTELEAAAEAANAAVSLAEAEVARAQSELSFARSDLSRAQILHQRRTVSDRDLENASTTVSLLEAQLTKALATLNLRRSERDSARARLIQPAAHEEGQAGANCCVDVRAPVTGVALSVPEKSERVVPAGTVLAEFGDPGDLEIVVDLLSADAVRVEEGASAEIVEWGGGETLAATVRRIDPVGFTKVSALGIEEQRVNAVLDLEGGPAVARALGHDYRVFVVIQTREVADAVRIPLGALFRYRGAWHAFTMEDGLARRRALEIGLRNDRYAEVLSGLKSGDVVILHPGEEVADGGRVTPRELQED